MSQMCKSIINKDREYKNNVPRCPHIDMRYGLMQVGQASDPHEPLLGVKLLTTPCSDGGQNYSFFGSNYQLLGP